MKLNHILTGMAVLLLSQSHPATALSTLPTLRTTATLAGWVLGGTAYTLLLSGLYQFHMSELMGCYGSTKRMTYADMMRHGNGFANLFLLDAICAGDENDVRHAIISGASVNGLASSNYAIKTMWNSFYGHGFQRIFPGVLPGPINHNPFRDKQGYSVSYCTTPLICAARLGNSKIISLLLELGASIDHQYDGVTALHNAAYCGQPEAVKALLNAGANPNLADNKSHTPLTVATYMKQAKIVQLLLQHGATIPTDMQLKQLGLDSKSRTFIKEQARFAEQRSTFIEDQLLQKYSKLGADVAGLIRSFETAIKPIATATNLAAEPGRNNTNIIDPLIANVSSYVF